MKEKALARGLSSSYLEGGDEDDDDEEGGGVSLMAIKKQYKANSKREWGGGVGGGGGGKGMTRYEEGCHSWPLRNSTRQTVNVRGGE